MKNLINLVFVSSLTFLALGCASTSHHHADNQVKGHSERSVAALPPYWSTVSEFKAVLDSERVKTALKSQVIRSIKVNDDYTWTVLSDSCRAEVKTEYQRPVDVGFLAGAATFEASVLSSKCK